jgi:hypothetical protein
MAVAQLDKRRRSQSREAGFKICTLTTGFMNLTFEYPIHFTGRGRRRRCLRAGPAPAPAPLPEGTVPRISGLMALAIHFDRLLASGVISSLAELARQHRVTRARITQIMALKRLAAGIQETLLFLPRTMAGRAPVTERELRAVSSEVDWGRQSRMVKPLICTMLERH